MKWAVYFEIYGKKMRTTVEAKSEADAKAIVAGNLKICKCEEVINTIDDAIAAMEDMLGIKL